MEKLNLTIYKAILWTLLYFGCILFYTFLDVTIWRKLLPRYSNWLNVITIALCITVFILILIRFNGSFMITSNTTLTGIILAIGCSILFFILLDKCLDPFFEGIFPASEQDYQAALQTLIKSPVSSLIQVCILAPIVEEILMRSFILNGLKNTYNIPTALIMSTILFAILHFNWVQTFSALICGIILGLLYIKTDSIICCIVAHCGYNIISYFTMIYPNIEK